MEAAAHRFQSHGTQAEHVLAIARHRWQVRLGHDGSRRVQSVRFRGQGAVVAQSPDRLASSASTWGYASSPLLKGNALYVQVLHGMKTDDPSHVLKIDAMTGKTLGASGVPRRR